MSMPNTKAQPKTTLFELQAVLAVARWAASHGR